MSKTPGESSPTAAGYRYGYRHGMTQISTYLSFSLPLPDTPDLERLDRDLDCLFQLAIPPARLGDDCFADDQSGVAAQVGWRILTLAAMMQQAARVPALDPGTVAEVTPRENAFSIKVAIPLVDHTPAPLVRQAYESATRCILHLLRDPDAVRQPEKVWRQLNGEFIAPVSRNAPIDNSTLVLLKAAHAASIPFRHLGDGFYQLGWGCNATIMDRSSLGHDSAAGARASANKHLSACVLRAAGLPAPEHHLTGTQEQALAAARHLGMPVVIKPADRNRGEGVSIDIHDEASVAGAWQKAARESRLILVEKQVPGVCHRLYVHHGEVIYAVKRLPKSVVGDGQRTVKTLVAEANRREQAKPPWNRLKEFPLDDLARRCLTQAGLSPNSIPRAGQYAPLRPFATVEWGGMIEDLTDILHPDNRELAVRTAGLFGLDTAGVDLISPDVAQPWYSNGTIINEINYSPMLSNDPLLADNCPPRLIERAVTGDGRIPVEVYTGPDAMDRAMARQGDCHASGEACYLTSTHDTRTPSGEPFHLSANGLFDRCRALLVNRTVERLVVIMDSDEWQQTGLPFDAIHRIERGDSAGSDDSPLHQWLACYSL